jgi:hypothetical protein
MTRTDEGMTPDHEEGTAEEERDAAQGERANAGDPEHNTTPPGNPEADDDAVAKAEESLGRVTGR